MEITLLQHPCSFTPDGDCPMTPPVLIYPRWRLPYYTMPCSFTQMEITLLHQTGPLHIYHRWRLPYDTTPANLPQMEITLLHQTGPLLIYPRWRLPYDTTPANLPQMKITLLQHPCSFTPDGDYPTTSDSPC